MSMNVFASGERAHPAFFWGGAIAVTAGVLLHLPMYISSAAMNFHVAGMPVDYEMLFGMALILGGVVAGFYGLIPAAIRRESPNITARQISDLSKEAPANPKGGLLGAHWLLLT